MPITVYPGLDSAKATPAGYKHTPLQAGFAGAEAFEIVQGRQVAGGVGEGDEFAVDEGRVFDAQAGSVGGVGDLARLWEVRLVAARNCRLATESGNQAIGSLAVPW